MVRGGPLIGFLMIWLRATLNKPFGAFGGYVDVPENAYHRRLPLKLAGFESPAAKKRQPFVSVTLRPQEKQE